MTTYIITGKNPKEDNSFFRYIFKNEKCEQYLIRNCNNFLEMIIYYLLKKYSDGAKGQEESVPIFDDLELAMENFRDALIRKHSTAIDNLIVPRLKQDLENLLGGFGWTIEIKKEKINGDKENVLF